MSRDMMRRIALALAGVLIAVGIGMSFGLRDDGIFWLAAGAALLGYALPPFPEKKS
ncbi:MAG: hypothetical protein ABFD92_08490 [Planctomycetaceae bacterium]|nr:hypothetical protein [Planctomycetaceae bacterium]